MGKALIRTVAGLPVLKVCNKGQEAIPHRRNAGHGSLTFGLGEITPAANFALYRGMPVNFPVAVVNFRPGQIAGKIISQPGAYRGDNLAVIQMHGLAHHAKRAELVKG